MKTKRALAILLTLCMLIPCFTALPVSAADEGVELYHQICPKTVDEARKVWPANSDQGWLRICTMEDGTTYNQIEYYNNRNAQGGLPEGENMIVTIPECRIPTKNYEEVILTLQYAHCKGNSDVNIGEVGQLQIYASTDGGNTWSSEYAGLGVQSLVGLGHTNNNHLEAMVYTVTSTDLSKLVKKGDTITALKIRPYGDNPTHFGATRFQEITIKGYTTAGAGSAAGGEFADVGTIDVPEETLRQIVVDRMYAVCDVPWTTYNEIVTYNSNDATADEEKTMYYKPGYLYLGPTYTRKVKSTWEMFMNSINARGEYTGGVTDKDVVGMDCITIMTHALGLVSNSRHESWNYFLAQKRLPTLGDIKNFVGFTDDIVKANDAQTVYEGYAAMKPGDFVAHQTTRGDLHCRVETKAPEVVRTARGTIDPKNSKAFQTETRGFNQYYWETPEGKTVVSTGKNPAEYQAKHEDYKFLYGTTCQKDREITFEQLYADFYLPYTLAEYSEGKVFDVATKVKSCTPANELTEKGLSAILVSNWPMLTIHPVITDMDTGRRVWDEPILPQTGAFEYVLNDFYLSDFIQGLEKGAYELTVDVTAGPVTTIGGSVPVNQVIKMDFAVDGAAIPAGVKTLDTAGADGWAVNWLTGAFGRGLLSEMNQSGFTKDVTRLQFADMAVRLAEVVSGKEIEPAGSDSFTDTTEASILKAKAAGISAGYEKDGKYEFRPNNPITRQEICVMLDHVAEYIAAMDEDKELKDFREIAEKFIDRGEVADWAKRQVARMTGNMVMGGKATDKGDAITPQANTTLQEAVTLVIKLDNMIK